MSLCVGAQGRKEPVQAQVFVESEMMEDEIMTTGLKEGSLSYFSSGNWNCYLRLVLEAFFFTFFFNSNLISLIGSNFSVPFKVVQLWHQCAWMCLCV